MNQIPTGIADHLAAFAVHLARIEAACGNVLADSYNYIDAGLLPHKLVYELTLDAQDNVVLAGDRLVDAGYDVKVVNGNWRWRGPTLIVKVPGAEVTIGAER